MLPFAKRFIYIEFANDFFYLLFGYQSAKFGPLLMGQPHSPNFVPFK